MILHLIIDYIIYMLASLFADIFRWVNYNRALRVSAFISLYCIRSPFFNKILPIISLNLVFLDGFGTERNWVIGVRVFKSHWFNLFFYVKIDIINLHIFWMISIRQNLMAVYARLLGSKTQIWLLVAEMFSIKAITRGTDRFVAAIGIMINIHDSFTQYWVGLI